MLDPDGEVWVSSSHDGVAGYPRRCRSRGWGAAQASVTSFPACC